MSIVSLIPFALLLAADPGPREAVSSVERSPSLLEKVLRPLGEGIDPGRVAGTVLETLWTHRPEWADMLIAILKGDLEEGGWWRPSASLYGWAWLEGAHDADSNGRIDRMELPVSQWFDRLDRDRDGNITREDIEGPVDEAVSGVAESLFRRLDADSNDRVSWDELSWLFQQADRGKRGFITRQDLQEILAAPPGPRSREQMPSRTRMLQMLLAGELGSFREGPSLGAPAPDFRLATRGGELTALLSDSRGKRPVVLVFGSFT